LGTGSYSTVRSHDAFTASPEWPTWIFSARRAALLDVNQLDFPFLAPVQKVPLVSVSSGQLSQRMDSGTRVVILRP